MERKEAGAKEVQNGQTERKSPELPEPWFWAGFILGSLAVVSTCYKD